MENQIFSFWRFSEITAGLFTVKTSELVLPWAYNKLRDKFCTKNGIDLFKERLKHTNKWEKVNIHPNNPKWIYKDEPQFIIELYENESFDKNESFSERWVSDLCIRNDSTKVEIGLFIGNTNISERVTFVYIDNAKWLLPIPKMMRHTQSNRPTENDFYYRWEEITMDYNLFLILGKVDTVNRDLRSGLKFVADSTNSFITN